MKKAILRHDDQQGFILIDAETESMICRVDAGSNPEDVNWNLVEQQANAQDYTIED